MKCRAVGSAEKCSGCGAEPCMARYDNKSDRRKKVYGKCLKCGAKARITGFAPRWKARDKRVAKEFAEWYKREGKDQPGLDWVQYARWLHGNGTGDGRALPEKPREKYHLEKPLNAAPA